MSFQTGLAGLNASSKRLDVIGNNIANASTVGAKSSRAEFAALVSSASSGGNGEGIGVAVATVSQQFSQGSINITGNNLDVAINGRGFFQIKTADGESAYTRDGQFKLDRDGNVVTNQNANLLGFTLDAAGTPTSITPEKLTVPLGAALPASATTTINLEMNLDARAKVAATAPVTPRATYGTSLTTFDAQGNQVPVNLYFVKVADTPPTPGPASNNWEVYDSLTATTPIQYDVSGTPTSLVLQFDTSGKLLSPPATTLPEITIPTPSSITPDILAKLNISKVTQFASSFAVTNLAQNGYSSGELTGVSIDPKGILTTTYSNGQNQRLAQITLSDFRNPQGLASISGGAWIATSTSGLAIQGKPMEGKFGEVRSGALEDSNVDLTGELVAMMTAQRSYQANAQTIKTQDQVIQTLVNLR